MAEVKKILVLDDDPKNLQALFHNLEKAAEARSKDFGGCMPHFERKQDADSVVQRIKKKDCPWDIIVADVFMPPPGGGVPHPACGAVSIYHALETIDESKRPLLVMTSNFVNDVGPTVTPLLLEQRKQPTPWAVFYHKPADACRPGQTEPLLNEDAWRRLVVDAVKYQQNRQWMQGFIESGFEELVMLSVPFEELKAEVLRNADFRFLAVVGETGSGKEAVARSLHLLSSRRAGEYRRRNIHAFGAEIVNAEFFGAEKGAYTGCTENRIGLLTICNHGTVFLDEFGPDMSGSLAKAAQISEVLSCVMEDPYNYVRLGDSKTSFTFEGGLIFGGSRLEELLESANTHRAWRDLRGRIQGIMRVPPLREHQQDILPLARHFLQKAHQENPKNSLKTLLPSAEKALINYSWPENIRELKHTMQRAATEMHTRIEAADLKFDTVPNPPSSASAGATVPAPDYKTPKGMDQLLEFYGTQKRVAEVVGLTERAIEYWMQKHRKDPEFSRKRPPQRPPSPS